MRLTAGAEQEYERRHRDLWPELAEALREHGVLDYSIFLDPRDGSLFGCVEVSDEELWERIAQTDVCRRWWAYMAPLMDVHHDLRPRSEQLRTVFRLAAVARPNSGAAGAGSEVSSA